MNTKRVALTITVFAFACLPTFAVCDELSAKPTVTTFSGSGRSGILDGDSQTAQFIQPTGIAIAPNGDLLVTDRAAQRVRAVHRDGSVTTVAGSGALVLGGLGVAGGYRDGLAAKALFNQPIGIAVASDGTVYVGDTKNHCVRIILNGMVHTLRGLTLRDPRSLAIDRNDTLYVADLPNALYAIPKHGAIKKIMTTKPIVALAAGQSQGNRATDGGPVLYASTLDGIDVYHLPELWKSSTLDTGVDTLRVTTVPREGYAFMGPAIGIAAIDDNSFVYADPLFRTVRYVALPIVSTYARSLTREPLLNAQIHPLPLRDGPGDIATFLDPQAIVRTDDGSIYVADAGAKRIRRLSAFDTRNPESSLYAHSELPTTPNPHECRIALIGNSYVNNTVSWEESIAGVVEARLSQAKATTIRILPIRRDGATPTAILSYVSDILTSGVVNAVVIDLPAQPWTTDGAKAYVGGLPQEQVLLESVKRELNENGIPLYVIFHPGSYEIPGEMSYRLTPRLDSPEGDLTVRDPAEIDSFYQATLGMLKRAGVKYLDLWPAMIEAHASASAQPLFNQWDHHFSAYGDKLVGEALAQQLLLSHPWTQEGTNGRL